MTEGAEPGGGGPAGDGGSTVPFHAVLRIGDRQAHVEGRLPAAPAPLRDLLPVFHALDEMFVSLAADAVRTSGETITCRAGCGACCRQFVPVSRDEAHRLAALVASMPPERRERVGARFAGAASRLRAAGALPAGWDVETEWTLERYRAMGLRYFSAGVPCPFLEEESCSIHPERPLACREYSVTTPASVCAAPTEKGVRTVPLAVRLSKILYLWDRGRVGDRIRWLPLVLSLEYAAETGPPPPEPIPAGEVFERILRAAEEETRSALRAAPPPPATPPGPGRTPPAPPAPPPPG